ncbi:MAG: extracellular solute-binding protein [Deltaproteobacteria bacterium]|nr:extracellular solute-binding protein [Deltaproteobacteria bacterium]
MKRKSLFICVLAVASFVLAESVQAASVDELVAAAKKEGAIEFYAASTFGPQGGRALGKAFNQKYGLDIKVNYTPSSSYTTDVGKVVSRAAMGMPPDMDVMIVMDTHHATLWLKRLHETFDYKKVGVNTRMIRYGGGTVAFANQFILPAYNKTILPTQDAPRGWDDLLDSKWKGGKLGVSSDLTHLAMLSAGPWGEKRATEYVKSLAKQELNLGTLGQAYTRLQIGEILIAVTMTDSFTHRAKEKGVPIVFAEGIEPVISLAYNAGVVKGARHPNAGHLFVAFLASLEAQEIWEKYNGQTSPFVPGTKAYKYVQGKQVVYMTQETAVMVDRLTKEYAKLLGFEK